MYDDNGSPEDINDDNDKLLTSAPGQGNLPSNTVYSIALDNDGEVWVGTDNGIGVFTKPARFLFKRRCSADSCGN